MPAIPTINEFVFNHAGSDTNEFVEIIGDPLTDYSAYWILQVEGDDNANQGRITSARQLGNTNEDGFWVSDFENNTYQNGSQTLALVQEFTGAEGDQLTIENGSVQNPPWSALIDTIAVNDGDAGDVTFGGVELSAFYDGNDFTPGGASRIPDATDTDMSDDWVRNDFDGEGLPGLSGDPADDISVNTPGASNTLAGDVDDGVDDGNGDDGNGDDDNGDNGEEPAPEFRHIFTIQGAGHTSDYAGQTVRATGVVTALEFNGFFVQDPIGDNDVATSDGIFVFTGGAPGVAVGDGVVVEGQVSEFTPGGEETGNLSSTQIGASEVTVVSSGNDLPAATVIGASGRVPPNTVIEDDNFSSFDVETDGIDFYESVEGMRVTIEDAAAISGTNRFGETWVLANQGADATGLNSRGGISLAPDDANPERIQIQYDGDVLPGFSPDVDVRDKLGDVTGVVDYNFGFFEVKVTDEFDVTDGGLEQEVTELAGTDNELTVASYNVFNLSPDENDDAQRNTIAQQIVNNLKSPDVIALQEIQDDSGESDDGTVSAGETLQALVDAIAAAGGPEYNFFDIAPENNTQGGVPGGNIRVAYLYNPERVDLVEDSVTQIPLPDGVNDARIPLEADFQFNGNTVKVINNHLPSKFGSTPLFGAVQPFINAGDEDRKAVAQALNDYVDGLVAQDPEAKVVLLGDLNDFKFAEPIQIVKGEGEDQVLYNKIDELEDDAVYTFNFRGNSQVLDHLMVTEALRDKTAFDIVHVNNDFAFSGVGSDHEPILARITLDNPAPVAPTPTEELEFAFLGRYEGTGAEIVAHDPATQRLFVTNGEEGVVDVLDISDPENPEKISALTLPAGVTADELTSVAVTQGLVAAAAPAEDPAQDGQVLFYSNDGFFLGNVTVGNLPDSISFTPDGSKLLVANEGEPVDDEVDPWGSVSIIDLSDGLVDLDDKVLTLDFSAFNGREEEFREKGIRLFPDKSLAEDLEPEFVVSAPDGKTAFVTLQEANAFAVVDLESGVVKDLIPLGVKDHSRGEPTLTTYDLTDALPTLGTTDAGQDIKLGGLSGLHFAGMTGEGKYIFTTVPDRGPNPDKDDYDGDGDSERPFALPEYQARVESFTLDPETGEVEFTDSLFLSRFDKFGNQLPIIGISNRPGDEDPIDIFGNSLPYDAFGGDMEGLIFDGEGNIWMVDEYRPSIYKFNPDGILLNRFIPEGTAVDLDLPEDAFGTETLPQEYAERRPNRGFEALALDKEKGVLYAFIQTPMANPDRATSDASDIIRILGIDTDTGIPVAEYAYLLEAPDHRESKVDKIGDAVYQGDGKFLVIERDSATGETAKKPIFEIDITNATNLLSEDAPALPEGATLESLTADELIDLGISPVNKMKVLNLPSIGYQAGDKPEGLTLLPDGRIAVLNDNDFSLTGALNSDTGEVGLTDETNPVVLGIIDFEEGGNALDASNRDDAINIQNYPIYGMYMPDGIASYEANGNAYFITANEGDARDEDVRVKDLVLDPEAFPNWEELQKDENLGRLKVSSIDGDYDGDGDHDALFAYGGRSFTIWDEYGNKVFDSGDDFERIMAEEFPDHFNSDNDEVDSFDSRSDDKGPEPEGVTVGEIDGETYAFIGLERMGAIMVYNVTDPSSPEYVDFINSRDFEAADEESAGDLAPEGLAFIDAEDSPTGRPMLAVAYEESSTTALYDIDLPEESYKLQILHASDLEGGVEAIDRAANFAAIADHLEDTHENSITLSAGDNYIPGPFFAAANDRAAFRDSGVFNDVYNALFGLSAEDGYGGLREAGGRADVSVMNIIGFDASVLGNHEFDAGTSAIEDIIRPDFRGEGLGDDRWVGSLFPYLSANLDFSEDGALSGLFTSDILTSDAFASGPDASLAGANVPKIAPATIIEEGGEKIGVVGATTPLLASISSPGDVGVNGNGNDMAALAAILQPVIDDVMAEGVNKVVLVTHLQQISLEKELAGLLKGVDVIIAGGSDTLQADAEDVARGLNPGDEADEGYPFTTTNADGDPVAIVSTDGQYSYVGRLVVEFDEEGVLILDEDGNVTDASVSGAFATTEEQVTAVWGNEDPFAENSKGDLVDDLVDAVTEVVVQKDGNVFGKSDVYLDGERSSVRTEETNFGNLSADANLAAARSFDDSVMVSLKNGGGIRAPIGEVEEVSPGVYEFLPPQANPASGKEIGEISQLDIENTLKFNNGLTLLTLTAAQLLDVIEHGVAASGNGATPGQFPQVGGISFSFDASLPAGERVQSMAALDDNGNPVTALVENGELVVDPGMPIRIVTLDFLAGGGDGYPFADFEAADPAFANRVNLGDVLEQGGAADFAPAGSEQDALADYLAANFADTPFMGEETPASEDTRIQNLEVRDDTVLDGIPEGEAATLAAEAGEAQDAGAEEVVVTDMPEVEADPSEADAAGDFEPANSEPAEEAIVVSEDEQLFADHAGNYIDAGAGDDSLTGNAAANYFEGGDGADMLRGEGGADLLRGGAGDDLVMGGDGADVLEGGLGEDLLFGGDGADEFVFTPGDSDDSVLDFEPGVDSITLQGLDGAAIEQVITGAVQQGADVLLTLDAETTITLAGVDKENLSDDSFTPMA